jgi:hypothetical protein
MIALVGFASLVIAPLQVEAAPGVDEPASVESDEPPLDSDSDEPPLDSDSDEPPPPELDEQLDSDTNVEVDDGYNPLRDSPEAKVARRWLSAGIAATVTGGVLVGGAVAFALSDPCDPTIGNNCFVDSRNRAAVTMGVPGGVLLLGGVAMTVVGALQKRRLFFDYAGSVTAGRDHIGVVIGGRF